MPVFHIEFISPEEPDFGKDNISCVKFEDLELAQEHRMRFYVEISAADETKAKGKILNAVDCHMNSVEFVKCSK